ncbi:hypothetical protein ACFWD7_57600, partial [Streptomyces mirabilis]
MEAGLAEAFELLLPYLDERQLRLVLGAAARVRGRGGIRLVAGAAGVAESTVSRGVRELEQGGEPSGRVRAPLAEATGLTKGRIGATLRDAAPVLAALGYT